MRKREKTTSDPSGMGEEEDTHILDGRPLICRPSTQIIDLDTDRRHSLSLSLCLSLSAFSQGSSLRNFSLCPVVVQGLGLLSVSVGPRSTQVLEQDPVLAQRRDVARGMRRGFSLSPLAADPDQRLFLVVVRRP